MIEAGLFGLLAAILWGSTDFLSRKPSQKIGSYLSSGYMLLFSFFGLLLLALLTNAINFQIFVVNAEPVLINLLIGAISFFAFMFLFRSYAIGVMSIVAPIVGTYPLVSIILAFTFLGENLTPVREIAIAIVIAGVILTGMKLTDLRALGFRLRGHNAKNNNSGEGELETKTKTTRFTRGLWSAIMASILFGVTYFSLSQLTLLFGLVLPLVLLRGGAVIASFVFLAPLKEKLVLPSGGVLTWLIVMAILDTFGNIAINSGFLLAGENLPLVVTLSSLLSAVTVLLARAFYKEKLDLLQAMGVVLLIGGVGSALFFG
jgi:drug/metabolite transporter (DMT)-like permease